jgi:DNA polymerase
VRIVAKRLYIDFETYSACELKTCGLANYATDATTNVHCMAYAFDDEDAQLVLSPTLPLEVGSYVIDGGLVYAHNAQFEYMIWNHVCAKHDWPPLKFEQLRCTLAMAFAMGLPGSLENAACALGLPDRKNLAGRRIMLQLAKPRSNGGFWRPKDSPQKFLILYQYCRQDVAVERALHERLVPLSREERAIWILDQKINQRGVRLDLEAVDRAANLVDREQRRLSREMSKATDGDVTRCTNVGSLSEWIKRQGVEMNGVAKDDVLDALGGNLPKKVAEVLSLRREAAKASTAKLISMRNNTGLDGRVRYVHQYHGAFTGRWAGRGIQVQNLPRPRPSTTQDDIEGILEHLKDGSEYIDMFYGPVMDALADCIRGMIIAPEGKTLVAVDFNAVEARVLAWMAGEERVLEIFRTHGRIYEQAASDIYQIPIDKIRKADRQIGKVAILALGYGGGKGAFQAMAKGCNVKVTDDEAERIKNVWRNENRMIVRYWYALEEAAIAACIKKDKRTAGPPGREVTFLMKGSFLWCRLPSGRVICYPYPEVREVATPWGELKSTFTYMTMINVNRKGKVLDDPGANGSWQRISTFGGSLAENVVQGLAACLLRHALRAVDAAGFDITMHVHDEIVAEVPEADGAAALARIKTLMTTLPTWATGLPIAADGWHGKRYRK